ncbi:MlaE family lipid ABC transporter permease subunit [Candidatus Nitronereus thalassa]|uniref:MlaE family lipid ABC transporter permease subunit n=1 Tax=Candidatus Nitronereus thalassa TaxID=3020898 RepID=A0ABU3K8R5_9BACT|nr:MlaE family lipid ABC transporter permease subunit [Candidatus Nitronereus thalassa]MDT7042759.1 MlaE family lipid ABC transporter permease subunit [Candidatus Nitronereus thalassa]
MTAPKQHISLMTKDQNAKINIGEDQTIYCEGCWTISKLADLDRRLQAFSWPTQTDLVWDGNDITAIDTGGALVLHRSLTRLQQQGHHITWRRLRAEFAELLKLVANKQEVLETAAHPPTQSWLERIGMHVWTDLHQGIHALGFLGESTIGLFGLLGSPRSIRWRVLIRNLELDGFHALPIVGLLSFLMGVVIAYQGAEQLRTFGANIFIVDLVGVSLLREIAPLVTAILVAGRSGSAYTAQIGTMNVTEELDALRTLGISPMNYLVLPRALVLVLALPLLTVYADIVGVFGGMLIAKTQLGVSFTEFIDRFEYAIALKHYVIGIIKAPVFAVIIALTGCYQGFQIRGSVDSVGQHTTISVVQSIFLVIVFDAFFSVFLSWWGI